MIILWKYSENSLILFRSLFLLNLLIPSNVWAMPRTIAMINNYSAHFSDSARFSVNQPTNRDVDSHVMPSSSSEYFKSCNGKQVASSRKLKANSVKYSLWILCYPNSFPDFLARKKITAFRFRITSELKTDVVGESRIFCQETQ